MEPVWPITALLHESFILVQEPRNPVHSFFATQVLATRYMLSIVTYHNVNSV